MPFAPRDPLRPETVPPDPPPLATVLAGVLRSAAAQAARAVDGRSGETLAEVGLADGDDVDVLVQLSRGAVAVGRSTGEWLEDVVVTLGRTVHVLRECGGAVLHARLDPARGDVAAVRRALAAAETQRAVEVARRSAGDPVPPALSAQDTVPSMRPVVPRPAPAQPAPPAPARARPLARLPEPPPPPPPLPVPRAAPGVQEPALVQVDGGTALTRTGALAVLALPPVEAAPVAPPPVPVLPRRRRAAVLPPAPPNRTMDAPPVLRKPWAADVDTMRRLLAGLHRME
jgi:hypothetical protein